MAFNLSIAFFKNLLTSDKTKFKIRDSDVFLVSYPKSGNTWLRFLIGNYISNDFIDFTKSNLIIPDIDVNPEQINNIKTFPRFIKSHFTYTPEYKNVIYIIRDGRDVAVSYYYHQITTKKIDKNVDFRTYFYSSFMESKSKFGGWGEHVESWKLNRANILYIKYEDLLNETEKKFNAILQYSGLQLNTEKLHKAIDSSSFKSMRNIESQNSSFIQKEYNTLKDHSFVRKGVIGDWKNHFDKEMLNAFNTKYSSLMHELGYSD